MSERLTMLLSFTGLILFTLGLATGFAIPAMRAPRLGLSAHLAGTQCGIALVALGLLWPRLHFWSGWGTPLANVVWISFYLLWFGLVLAAWWGTGKPLPLAGAGHLAKVWQDRIAMAPVAIGSLGSFAAFILILAQWRFRP